MKKMISTFALGALLATTANADFARVEAGAGGWMQTPSGIAEYNSGSAITGSDTLNEDMDTSAYVWMLVKHPLPIIPNVRVEYTTIHATGNATGSWNGLTVTSASADSELDITEYDIIPYYNILDNTFWITVDLGLDIKVVDSDYKIDSLNYEDTSTTVVPMLYLRGRVEIPTTDLGVEADAKYISNGSSTIYDVRAKLDYTFDITPIIQPGLEVGYRVQKINIDEDDVDVRTDIDFAGLYVGAMLRF